MQTDIWRSNKNNQYNLHISSFQLWWAKNLIIDINEYYLVGDSTYLDTLLWKSTPSCSESMETWAFSSVDRVCLQTSVAILILLNDRRLSLISSLYFLWEKIKPEEEYWTKNFFIFHWYFLWLWFNKILQIKEIILVKFLSQKVC